MQSGSGCGTDPSSAISPRLPVTYTLAISNGDPKITVDEVTEL